jgi:Lon protease-like protein
MFMEMYLPIFPLNTVLFPGTTLELQIFEERYKKMIYSALTNQSRYWYILY